MSFDLESYRERFHSLEAVFHLDRLRDECARLDHEMEAPEFWNQPEKAASVQKKRSQLQEIISAFDAVGRDLKDIEEFSVLAEGEDPDLLQEIETAAQRVQEALDALEFKKMLSGELDASSAIVSINSGAGGTEAQDWVAMLLRMYLRWAEEKKFGIEVIDSLAGEGAGYKNVTFTLDGPYAYGYLKAEQGIHRLVRISPFDANARRHTSFASVSVLPQIEDDVDIEIKEEDLRIDTFRAGGAGGQHVNKTDSAVRLTHLPTGLVVICQNERSQHKNRASAMKVLRARLYELKEAEKQKQQDELAGEKKGINFGSQIRSYTLQPYQLIKDHRSGFETAKVQDVLDGDLDGFIKAYLMLKAKETVA